MINKEYEVIRLKPNSDIYLGILEFCNVNKIKAGAVVAAVGCVKEISIRQADGKTIYNESNDFEITALSGTISESGLHLHIQLCDNEFRNIGGHLMPGTIINTTLELVILILSDYVFTREFDEATGYKELNIKKI